MARAGGTSVWMRRGLLGMGAYGVSALGYVAIRLGDVTAPLTGFPTADMETVAHLALFAGMIVPPVCLTLPQWGPRLDGAERCVRALVTYTRLAPLANAVRAYDPGLVLGRDAHPRRRGPLRDPHWHLMRRMVEYLDLRRALATGLAAEPLAQFERRALNLSVPRRDAAAVADAAALCRVLCGGAPASGLTGAARLPDAHAQSAAHALRVARYLRRPALLAEVACDGRGAPRG
jgi:uncharacterized protein DUF6545